MQSPPVTPQGPAGAPMAQPSPNDGARQMGIVQVETAMQMLEQALPQFGSGTPEGAAVLKAMQALSKLVTSQAQNMVPAQIAQLAAAQKQSPIGALMQGQGQPPSPTMQ